MSCANLITLQSPFKYGYLDPNLQCGDQRPMYYLYTTRQNKEKEVLPLCWKYASMNRLSRKKKVVLL